MTQLHYEAIVVGLGAIGAATLYQLAKRGVKVLGIDQYQPPHHLGSSHGESRITRLAIGEGDEYVPLVRRSHEIWRELEAMTGARLYHDVGGLIMAPRDRIANHHGKADFVRRTIACAERYGIVHEVLDAAAIARRYPQFALRGDELGYWERDAGYVVPEAAISAQLQAAQRHGAVIHTGESLRGYQQRAGGGITLETVQGGGTQHYDAGQLILAAGPWLSALLPDRATAQHFQVYRQVMYWFEAGGKPELFSPQQLGIFIWMFGDDQEDYMYGFPATTDAAASHGTFKVATEQYLATTHPEQVDRTVSAEEQRAMFETRVASRIPLATGRCIQAKACMYTVTPDRGFVFDRLPSIPEVIVASACSGHAFKHSAGIGERVAQLVLHETDTATLAPFRLSRFLV